MSQPNEWKATLEAGAPEADIGHKVALAVELLLQRDAALLIRDVNERAITGRLADYLRPHFPGWDVDCEYNRDDHVVKRIDGRAVVPDIIVHRRGLRENLLAIEVKKSNTREDDDEDIQKLNAFRDSHLHYQCGLFLKFLVGEGAPGIMRFEWI